MHRPSPRWVRLAAPSFAALVALLLLPACGGKEGGQDAPGVGAGVGTIQGRLAAPPAGGGAGALRALRNALSLSQVSIELVGVDSSGPSPVKAVVATATPDSTGAFSFTGVEEGQYSLRVVQPEFASVAYGVDSTELRLAKDQVVNVVLPIITTVIHGFLDLTAATGGSPASSRPIALDRATGEVVIVTPSGIAIVDPEKGTVDALRSHSLFTGPAVVALPPTRGIVWILYDDRIVRVDRSVFLDPDASEAIDLEEVAKRAQVGDKVRYRLLRTPPAASGYSFTGSTHFSPDEKVLFASAGNQVLPTVEGSVVVVDLEGMKVLDDVPGRLAGYNPASNQLFLQARTAGSRSVTLSVVDATTRFDVMPPVAVENFLGLSPFQGSTRTLLLGSQLNTSSIEIPFVTVVDRSPLDGSGVVSTPWTRARDWLGGSSDPAAAPPVFDAAGQYLTIGEKAYRLLAPSGFQEVTGGIPPGNLFLQDFQGGCLRDRPVDTTHLYQLWFSCSVSAPVVGLVSLDKANIPVAVRPGVDTQLFLVDEARGRAIFRGDRQLVFVHYADPTATARTETTDLSALVAPWFAPGAACSAASPCGADALCIAPTYTSGSGSCVPNPRLPYRPLCGGFEDRSCDAGFTCTYVNAARHQMGGTCTGMPDRAYATSGFACGGGGECPAGMACTAGRCVPKSCFGDADCAGPEICGLVPILGRTCLSPGPLPDGAHCLDSSECAGGACLPVKPSSDQGGPNSGHRGLMVCTTPCFEQADCAAGSFCRYRASSVNTQEVWSSHRPMLASYCSPPIYPLEMLACAATCGAAQLCRIESSGDGACRVGYSPVTAAGSQSCLPPAVPSPTLVGCAFTCDTSGDCPYATSCIQGVCAVDDVPRCAPTCGAAESCAPTDGTWTQFACVAQESCFTDGDCSAGTCSMATCN